MPCDIKWVEGLWDWTVYSKDTGFSDFDNVQGLCCYATGLVQRLLLSDPCVFMMGTLMKLILLNLNGM